jgi:hypothetical protein
MEPGKNFFKLSRSQWISVAVLASSLGVAAAVSLTTFTAGTTISASAVNANFTALNNALPQVWASTDSTAGGVTVSATATPQTVNSVSINVPAGGHLIIAGSVFINNDSTTVGGLLYNLNPLIDGIPVPNAAFIAAAFTAPDTGGVGADSATLSYSVTTPVTAGSHTVSQQVFAIIPATTAAATATYFYNHYDLTVVFVPQISGFTAAQAPFGESAPAGLPGKTGTPQEEYGL